MVTCTNFCDFCDFQILKVYMLHFFYVDPIISVLLFYYFNPIKIEFDQQDHLRCLHKGFLV